MTGLYAIPPEKPFLEVLASHLLRRYGADGGLSRVLVLLPTRRSGRSLREALLKQSGGQALLLPRIQPIGDMEAEGDFMDAPDGFGDAASALPPPVSRIRRQVLLTRLVARFHHGADSPHGLVQAAQLATQLATLFDEVERAQLDFSALEQLAPADFAEHWQLTLRFLDIVATHWPKVLKEQGVCDPIARRNALIEAVAERWSESPPAFPVIAAGSTGSQPATARLLSCVAGLDEGMVVLPGFDPSMPDAVWDALDETHPHYVLKSMLASMGAKAADVRPLDEEVAATCPPPRIDLMCEALKPAPLTDGWRGCAIDTQEALKGVMRLECDTTQDEARVIAVMLREALETTGKTAAVVTQDRTLARMLAATLERYGVTVDDSAGKPLSQTRPGIFLRLLARAAASLAAPVELLAALKHPLCAFGMEPEAFATQVRVVERAALRGPRLDGGLSGILAQLAARGEDAAEAHAFFAPLAEAMEPFFSLCQRRTALFSSLMDAHLALAERLAADGVAGGLERLWSGEEGECLAQWLGELKESASQLGLVEPAGYPGLLDALMAGQVYRPSEGAHPRLRILSPQEARLERADLTIVAGLSEGVWPPAPEASPWMSRPMQRRFGLPVPEQAVGRSAHDFLMIAGAKELALTRARKCGGSPAVPSRWLLRLDTLLQALEGKPHAWPDLPYAQWAAQLEQPLAQPPFVPPSACPAAQARPRRLSVTQVDTWQRDPYSIYARHVLKLSPLDPIDQEPDAARFGVLIHEALERFIRAWPERLPDDTLGELLAAGRDAFAPCWEQPAVQGFWWPRYEAMARWVAQQERERRGGLSRVTAEVKGSLSISAPAGPFTLTTQIDRLEQRRDGSAALIDYKTGTVPETRDVNLGLSSQLPLEALILARGRVSAGNLVADALEYWRLAGEGERNQVTSLGTGRGPGVRELVEAAASGVERLISAFDDPATPYLACPDPSRRPRYNDYEHLERLREWAVV